MEHMTRAEARRRASTPPIVVHENRTPEETEQYIAAMESATQRLRDWAIRYAPLIDDPEALQALDDIVSSSTERILASRDAAIRSETLMSLSETLRALAESGGKVDDLHPRP